MQMRYDPFSGAGFLPTEAIRWAPDPLAAGQRSADAGIGPGLAAN